MSATTTINAPTTIITVPCLVDDLAMDSLCHCTAAHARDERHHPPAHIGTYGRHGRPIETAHIAGYDRQIGWGQCQAIPRTIWTQLGADGRS
jgi:hypothetical protein